MRVIIDQEDRIGDENVLLSLGQAEDGLNLFYEVPVDPHIRELGTELSNVGKADQFSRKEKKEITILLKNAADIITHNIAGSFFKDFVINSEPCRLFATDIELGRLFNPSLFSMMIKNPNAAFLKNRSSIQAEDIGTHATGKSKRYSEGIDQNIINVSLQEETKLTKYLGIDIRNKRLYILKETEKGKRNLLVERLFLNESLSLFKDVEFEISYFDGKFSGLKFGEFAKVMKSLVSRNVNSPDVSFKIPNASIIEKVIQIGRVLHENFHQNNFVHGDIKPQNILLTKSGPELIDDLKLRNREISFLATPGWGAPEQIMTRPVSFSSDIYSLGLILTSLIHGTLTGELTYNVLASRSGSVRISPMIKDPKVYLTPDNTIIEGKGALRWMELIETCLRFDLSNRFRDAKEFTTELAILNKDYPLHGIMETRFSRGDLTIIESALFDKSHCHIITNGNNFLIPMDLDDCTGD